MPWYLVEQWHNVVKLQANTWVALFCAFLAYFWSITCICVPIQYDVFSFDSDPSGFILFPLVVHSFDLVVSTVGIFSIRGTRETGVIAPVEDPMTILQKGYSLTIVLAVLAFGLVILNLHLCSFNLTFLYFLDWPSIHCSNFCTLLTLKSLFQLGLK